MLSVKKRRFGDQHRAKTFSDPEEDCMTKNLFMIEHHEIQSNPDGQYLVSRNRKHESLNELIAYHREAKDDTLQ